MKGSQAQSAWLPFIHAYFASPPGARGAPGSGGMGACTCGSAFP